MKKKKGGWVQRSVTQVYDNPWISVTHEAVFQPDGSEGVYGVVHFKNTAVGVVPIDDQGYTYLVKQTRYTLNQSSLEIPEGGSPIGESCLQSAQRELKEETGLVARDWQELIRLHTSNSVTDEAGVIYIARGLSQGAQALEATEDIECVKMHFSEALNLVLTGQISDAMSQVGIMRVALMYPDLQLGKH